MTFSESTGDEWKRGTRYEDREVRAYRELADAAEQMARGFAGMAEAMSRLHVACVKVWAVTRLVCLGLDEARALDFVEGLHLVADAEGRPFADVVRTEIERIEAAGDA